MWSETKQTAATALMIALCFSAVIDAKLRCPKTLEKCICGMAIYDRQEMYVVNCTDTGFMDAEMLKDLPEETQALIFTGNKIKELPWNVFGEDKELSSLKYIDMSNNNIEDIKGKSYHHVSNVQRLILNHNNLKISSQGDENHHHPRVFSNFENLLELHLTNAFADNTDSALANDLHDIFEKSNLTKLYKLHLEQNEIKSFRYLTVFCDLPSLRDLYLGDNNIPGLNFKITCLKKLQFLDLERNNITRLGPRELELLDSMVLPHRNLSLVVDLGSNPFKCETSYNLYNWMHKTSVQVRNKEHLQCHTSKYGTKYILNLSSMAQNRHARFSKAITVLLVVLALILVTLVGALVYLNKDTIKNRATPIFDIVSKKVHYTTIESQQDV